MASGSPCSHQGILVAAILVTVAAFGLPRVNKWSLFRAVSHLRNSCLRLWSKGKGQKLQETEGKKHEQNARSKEQKTKKNKNFKTKNEHIKTREKENTHNDGKTKKNKRLKTKNKMLEAKERSNQNEIG